MTGYPAIGPDEGHTAKRYDYATRVRVKVTPYGADFAGILRGQAPAWSTGATYTLAHSMRNSYSPGANSRGKYVMSSRAWYRNGKQAGVNYLTVGHTVLGGGGLVMWNQIDLEQNTTAGYVMILKDDEGSQGYDSGLDMYLRGNSLTDFFNPFSPYFSGYGEPDAMDLGGNVAGWDCYGLYRTSATTAGDSIPFFRPRINAYQVGERYFVMSSYVNSDSVLESGTFALFRFDKTLAENPIAAWHVVGSTIWDPDIRFALVRPAMRSHQVTDGDEPWCCGYDRLTNRIGVGPWRHSGRSLQSAEMLDIGAPPGMQLGPNILCYNRVDDGRNLLIVRDAATIFPGGAGGSRSSVHWIYDGAAWHSISDDPSYITADKDGNILYGNRRFVRKLGAGGWHHAATGQFGDVVGHTTPPDQPPDDPEGEDNPTPPTYNSQREDHFFQIVLNKTWIHLQDFYGDPSWATSPLEHPDWPLYQIADRGNCIDSQAVGGDLFKAWSISYDGSIRVPHVQFHAPFREADPLLRIHGRMYVANNCSEGQLLNLGGEEWRWIKYGHSNYQCDWDFGHIQYKPWLQDYGNDLGGINNFTFIDHPYNFDFDIVDDCDCCCDGGAVSY